MKFKLKSDKTIWKDENEIKEMEKLGFNFHKTKTGLYIIMEDENLSDIEFKCYDGMDEIMNLIEKYGKIEMTFDTIKIMNDNYYE
jgi:hypothetical protein